jgi:hypothetical protein
MKDLVIFDLDGTLAPSKSSLDEEMAGLLGRLLGIVKAAIISGGALAQFEKQVLAFLPHDERLKGLSLLPTCGTQFYRFDGGWKKLYSEDFSATEKTTIIAALKRNFRIFGPDETISNLLGDVFKVTNRQWDAREVPNDEFLAPQGRVLDSMLSEHQCRGLAGRLSADRPPRPVQFLRGLYSHHRFHVQPAREMAEGHARTSPPPRRAASSSASNGITRQSTEAGSIWRNPNSAFWPANASIAASRTRRS